MTANGEPTTDIDQTVDYEAININDDWGIVTIYRDDITDF
jgi:hypothetical protein